MDYIQGLSEQTEIFFLSLGFGFLLGVVYDVFRVVRLIISRSAWFTVFMDILYFLICAFLIFSFNLVVDSGKIRVYVLLGDMLGWFIYYFSLGAITARLSNKFVSSARRLMTVIFRPVCRLKNRFDRKMSGFVSFPQKIMRKIKKKAKYDLQKYTSMVYNLNGYTENNTFKDK